MKSVLCVMFALVAIFVAGIGTAAAVDDTTICLTARLGSGLGAARVDFTLHAQTTTASPFYALSGQAAFSQPVAPPGSLIIYAVTGVAIPNTAGTWVSLEGAGYDLARTLYHGTFAAQVSNDVSQSLFSYTRTNIDGSGAVTSTSTIPIVPCSS